MFEDDLGPLLPPIEIARVVAALAAVERSNVSDGDGRSIEIYNKDPDELPQLKKALAYIQHRLCETTVGDGDNQFSASPNEFDLRYVQLTSHVDGIEVLQTGYRLTLCTVRFEVADDQVELLREAACRAASELLHGTPGRTPQTDEWHSPPIDPRAPEQIAIKIRETLLGQRIKQPFTFIDGVGKTLDFDGFFAGDEEENACLDPIELQGNVNQVTYRGETLSFRLEIEVGLFKRTEELTIEYGLMHWKEVHRLAEDRVQIKSEVRTSRLANGRTRTTYTLISIEAAPSLQFIQEDSAAHEHELVEQAL
jgi:hypothetical protein